MKEIISRERFNELIRKVNNDENLTEQDIVDLVIERKQRLEFRKKLKESYDKNMKYVYKDKEVFLTVIKEDDNEKYIYKDSKGKVVKTYINKQEDDEDEDIFYIPKNEELANRIYYKISDNEKIIDAIELYLIQSGNGARF